MDPLPTPHPVKPNNGSKPKINPKTNQAIQSRQNSINIIEKPVSNKTTTVTKPKFTVPRKQPKPIQTTQLPVDKSTEKVTAENVISPRLNVKKSDAFPQEQEGEGEKTRRYSQEKKDSFGEPKTPVVASGHARTCKAKVPATPFYSAVHCSKCRFDRLETSAYWIAQIKMAESVGKHFIAANFFRLALECQAEPIRNLRMELKRYMLRHGYLSEQEEWREVAARFGLLIKQVESNTSGTMNNNNESV